MRHVVAVEYTASLATGIKISYICEQCGHFNEEIEVKTITGRDVGPRNGSGIVEGARRDLMCELNIVQDKINKKSYKELDLNCRCEACKKKPIWSSFWKTPFKLCGIASVLFLIIAVLCYNGKAWTAMVVFIALCLVAILIICFYEIHNSMIKKKCINLNKEYEPVISFVPLNQQY